jgi:diguanylate cyclase (GGDEF)-like protein
MKKLFPAISILLGWASFGWAVAPAPLTTLRAVHALTNEEARQKMPVVFEATVVYSRGYENLLFVQDGDAAIFVRPPTNSTMTPGDRVLVHGTMQASFRPLVVGTSVTLLHHGPRPKPISTTFEELIRAQHDSMLVTMRAVVRDADLVASPLAPVRGARLQLLAEGGHFEANLDSDDANALKGLLDDEIEITGTAAGKFDNKMQQTGVVLYVSSLRDIKVLKHASSSPWSLPVTPMDKVLVNYQIRDLTPRVRVQGTITYYQPGSAVVLQNGAKSLWIETNSREPLQIGDLADATGFPSAHNRLLTLTDSEIRDSHAFQPVTPYVATWHQLGYWNSNRAEGHLYDLVSIEGQVVAKVREATQDEYVLTADGRLFSAIYHHPDAASNAQLFPIMQIPLGSRVRVTGICTVMDPSNTIVMGEEIPFNILLRSFDDITVVAMPSMLNIHNLVLVAGLTLLMAIAVGIWGWILNRKVRSQTGKLATMAQFEQRRSRILEDINGSKPLAEIIEQITGLVSFLLHDAPCWCEVMNGTRIGKRPMDTEHLRIVSAEIPAHSGPSIGKIFAALAPQTPPTASEEEALSVGSRLASLALETRRLYSDLLHRSEFDLLTDIYNRFSLEKHLDRQIEDARQNAASFGLIYIDIDQFKQVNDAYGHHVGDLYLQEAVQRMKQQLRAHDLLARLGGDEFAVLLPMVHSRADIEDVVQRLERGFDAFFSLDGHLLHGSASIGIALYPEDGTTGDQLLNAADAAMYAIKAAKHSSSSE